MRLTRSGLYVRPPPVPTMPPGLVELMEGLTRDVLQHNPADVYQFCAQHMKQLLLIRDGNVPTKQRPTLEQKIKRAQDKVRQKAEQRRRKYDEEMKKYIEDVNKALISSDKIIDDVTSSSLIEDDKLFDDEGKPPEDSILETNRKAPVHHEKDLVEALEVEIFHKPVEGTQSLNTYDAEGSNMTLSKETKELDEQLSEEIKNDIPIQLDLEVKQVTILEDGDANGNQQEIVHESTEESYQDHVILQRSVLFVEDKEGKEITNEVLKNQNDPPGNNTLDDKVRGTIPDETNNVCTIVPIDSTSANIEATEEPVDYSNTKDSTDNTTAVDERLLDSATVFATEANEAATLEKVNIDLISSQTTEEVDAHGSEDKNKLLADIVKTQIDSQLNDTSLAHTINDIDKVEFFEENQENALIEDTLEAEPIALVATEEVAANETALEIKYSNESGVEEVVSTISNEMASNKDEQEHHGDEETVIKATNEDQLHEHSKLIAQNGSFTNGHKIINEQESEKPLLDTDEKIIDAMQELQVSDGPLEIRKDKDRSIDNKHLTPESKPTKHVSEDESPSDELVVEKESDNDGNNDGAVTTVYTVLVEDSGNEKDDNDSAPVQKPAESMSNTVQEYIHVNGTHDVIEKGIVQNGSETLETNMIPSVNNTENGDTLKEKSDKIHNAQSDVTTPSEPIEMDLDTSSMKKSSSMDDRLIEVGIIDAFTAINEMKPEPECVQNKEPPSGMDLETAAVTIQKVFRTFLFKNRSSFEGSGIEEGNSMDGDSEKTEVDFRVITSPLNKDRRTLGISRMDTVLQTVNEEKSLSLSTDDSSLSSAATIIQAHVRGYLTRNQLNSNKTNSSSLVNSDGPSSTSLENDADQKVNKTILNIHIVPEGEHFMNRDESLLTSMEFSLDGSPPSSSNLHPLGYDKSEPRKQLKREDAIQSISPPSNNSGKLSEDSVKDMLITVDTDQQKVIDISMNEPRQDIDSRDDTPTKSTTIETVIEAHKLVEQESDSLEPEKEDVETAVRRKRSLVKVSSDESDVVTPFEEKGSTDSDATTGLLHSGEFHDIALPTQVSRGDTSVVREFKNVLAYLLIWNHS